MEGTGLSELRVDQSISYQFPLFIPIGTRAAASALPLAWAGVDARALFNEAKTKPVSLKPYLRRDCSIKNYLRLVDNTVPIAVLNGQDWLLEGFWGMRRDDLWQALKKHHFAAVTGPTFSITREGTGFPASHNVLMQRQHHKVVQEIQNHGLLAIPNIYWRDEDDIRRWQDWMSEQDKLQVVTRDFSLTKLFGFQRELDEFVSLLSGIGKPLHVLLVGVGSANGSTALRKLSQIGCTASILSSYPIHEAVVKGCELSISTSGTLSSEQNLSISREQLISKNIGIMERYLISEASSLPIYQPLKHTLPNFERNTTVPSELSDQARREFERYS